jgi:hypothetical protein
LGVERLLLLSRHFGEKRFEVEDSFPLPFPSIGLKSAAERTPQRHLRRDGQVG